MSQQYWELLAKITTASQTDLATVCQGLAREADAERLFCVVSTPRGEEVLAIDCDGYPLGFAAERLADGGLSDLVLRFTSGPHPLSEPQVVRRVSRASKRTVIAGKIRVGSALGVSLILENRFAGESLASFDDGQVVRWLIILALVVRLNAASEQTGGSQSERLADLGTDKSDSGVVNRDNTTKARTEVEAPDRGSSKGFGNVSSGSVFHAMPPSDQATVEPPFAAPEQDERQRADTLGALHQEHWNISRAARRLGMTRHGLKKRMRRLSLLKVL